MATILGGPGSGPTDDDLRQQAKDSACERTCPLLGVVHAVGLGEVMLAPGKVGTMPTLTPQFVPCIEEKCMFWNSVQADCLIKRGMVALVAMNAARSPAAAGVRP